MSFEQPTPEGILAIQKAMGRINETKINYEKSGQDIGEDIPKLWESSLGVLDSMQFSKEIQTAEDLKKELDKRLTEDETITQDEYDYILSLIG